MLCKKEELSFFGLMVETGGVKKEEGERSYKDVKKEEETCESMDGVEVEETTKKAYKTSKKKKKKKSKKVVTHVEVGESSRGRKKKAEKLKTLKKKKIKTVKKGVPEFEITIRKSYLKFLVKITIQQLLLLYSLLISGMWILDLFVVVYQLLPRVFEEEHIPGESMEYTIHHSEMKCSWNVLCLVRENRTVFSSGWSRLAREFPLKVGDRCTFKLIKPTEFVLITKKSRKEITVIG